MKKLSFLLFVIIAVISLFGCENKTKKYVGTWEVEVDGVSYTANSTFEDTQINSTTDTIEEMDSSGILNTPIKVKDSPDKYTWYIKNYIGKNCASIGYTSLGGDRLDRYGEGIIELIFVTSDGSYIDLNSEDDLKQYCVTNQNIAPNTEMKFTFKKDSDGNEVDYSLETQSFEEVVLSVKKVGNLEVDIPELTAINPSTDRHVRYIADYKGRNLANCGYVSMGGNLMHQYGDALIKFIIISEDGSFIDPNDFEILKNYVVTGQNISPNSELKIVYEKDSDGIEKDYLIEYQNIEEIELNVKRIMDN